MTIVDTNVISDILTEDRVWLEWSARALATQSRLGPLTTTDIVYAELSMHAPSTDELDRLLSGIGVQLARTPKAALYRAAHAYIAYRRSGGPRTGVLPDFLIGAHAEVEQLPILTRDVRRYRTYFPKLQLIAPT